MVIKRIYGVVLSGIGGIFGMDQAKKFDAWLRFRRRLDLKTPQSLADKVTFLGLHEHSPLIAKCTDKYEVRQYIKEKGLGDILIPLAGGPWNKTGEIDFDLLPERFVFKATHGCKMNYLVPKKKELDRKKCMAVMSQWLKTTYGTYSVEPHYLKIPHRIYAEEYLADADKLIDYKFHCMNGMPQFVLVCGNRKIGNMGNRISRYILDMNWDRLEGLTDEAADMPEKPEHFDEMIEIAEILSADFAFVRVDLYDVNGKIRFGELTFTPTGGVFSHYTQKFLGEMGEKLTLQRCGES